MTGRVVQVTLTSGAFLKGDTNCNSDYPGHFSFGVYDNVVCSPTNPRKKRYRDYVGHIVNAHNRYGYVQVSFGDPCYVDAFIPVEDLVPYRLWKEKIGFIPLIERKGDSQRFRN